MDASWWSYFNGFWIFPVLGVLFMAIMMIVCRGMHFRSGPTGGGRCCAAGEVSKKQNDAGQRIANG